jgi:hypothetical protein
MRTRTALVALAAVGLPCIAGCGDNIGIGAGEYTVVRIASANTSLSGDCNNDPNHTSTFRGGATILIYGVPGTTTDELFLDTGGEVLLGSQKDDGSFAFAGKQTDINDGFNQTITEVRTTTVSFTQDGDTIKGSFVSVDDLKCSGTGCQPNDSSTCTASAAFDGVQVQGADVPPPKG